MSIDAKEYLGQIQKINKVIENKNQEKEQWLLIASGTKALTNKDRVQSTPRRDQLEEATIQMTIIEEEIKQSLDLLIRTKMEVIKTIEKLPTIEYDLLHKVYIGRVVTKDEKKITEYMKLEDVANLYDKSYTWATTVHGRALEHLRKILEERSRKETTQMEG